MKPLLLLAVLTGSVRFAGCEATIVERRRIRPADVERDVRYRSHLRRDVVVPRDRPGYYRCRCVDAAPEVRSCNEGPRRYYVREGRRVSVNVDL